MDQLIGELLGPTGFLAGSLIAVGVLFREYRKVSQQRVDEFQKRIEDLIAQRDIAIAGWKDQMLATDRLADVVEDIVPVVNELAKASK